MISTSLLVIASLVGSPALAEGSKGFGPYAVNPDLTTGPMEFFREIYVDPETFPAQLKPVTASGDKGVLKLHNVSTAWADVKIGDTKVGKIGPLTTAVVHGVPGGTYSVNMTLPNGFSHTREIATSSADAKPPLNLKPDPNVKPEPLLEGSPPAPQ